MARGLRRADGLGHSFSATVELTSVDRRHDVPATNSSRTSNKPADSNTGELAPRLNLKPVVDGGRAQDAEIARQVHLGHRRHDATIHRDSHPQRDGSDAKPPLEPTVLNEPAHVPRRLNDNVRTEPAHFELPIWVQLAEPAQGRGGEQVDRRGVVQGPCPEHVVRILSVEVAPARIYVRDVWNVVLVLASGGFDEIRRTARPVARERTSSTVGSSLRMCSPSGSVIRIGGRGSPTRGGSTKVAQKFKRFGHMRGLFALATFPVSTSRRARARSPRSPRWSTALAFNNSPCIDFTG